MRTFVAVMKKRLGLFAVGAGLLLYALAYLFGWTTSNAVLLTALALVLGGTVLHVAIAKHMS